MARITFSEILNATGGRLIYGEPNGVSGVSIDSRTVKDGELFIAIRGARFDGHDFIDRALDHACGAIVSIPPSFPPRGKVVVHVQNTLNALQDIARYVRSRQAVDVLAITGSNGKTTTKEMCASVVGQCMSTLKNAGNFNNQIGLPLTILRLKEDDRAAVLEMGASCPGDIKELCSIASPDYAVITNIGKAHMECMKDMETVRSTKLEVLQGLKACAVNADDLFLMDGLRNCGMKLVKYGLEMQADVYASDLSLGASSSSFTLNYAGRRTSVNLNVAGRFNVYNALAAASGALMLGISVDDVKAGLESFSGIPMRLEIRELRGATLICDLYNANPSSMEESVKELIRTRRKRAVAVLGDMLELGVYGEEAHRKLGQWLSGLPVDLFIAVGPLMSLAADEFSKRKGKSICVRDSASAKDVLMENLVDGDTVLIKGSRAMNMEAVVENKEQMQGTNAI